MGRTYRPYPEDAMDYQERYRSLDKEVVLVLARRLEMLQRHRAELQQLDQELYAAEVARNRAYDMWRAFQTNEYPVSLHG